MILVILDFTEDIEQKDTHIFMQIFVIEEELGQKSKIFAIDWVFIAVYLKNSNFLFFISVDLITRRMEERANLGVAFELALEGEKAQAKITYIEAV